jgi:hypothetical protein
MERESAGLEREFRITQLAELSKPRLAFPERVETDKPKGLAGNAERLASPTRESRRAPPSAPQALAERLNLRSSIETPTRAFSSPQLTCGPAASGPRSLLPK